MVFTAKTEARISIKNSLKTIEDCGCYNFLHFLQKVTFAKNPQGFDLYISLQFAAKLYRTLQNFTLSVDLHYSHSSLQNIIQIFFKWLTLCSLGSIFLDYGRIEYLVTFRYSVFRDGTLCVSRTFRISVSRQCDLNTGQTSRGDMQRNPNSEFQSRGL
jgi:hypothetical protein